MRLTRLLNALAAIAACALIATVALLTAQGCAGNAPAPRRYLDSGVNQPTYDQLQPPPPVDAGGRIDSKFNFSDTTTTPPADQSVVAPDTSASTCRGGEQKFAGRCYRVIHGTDMTYTNAKAACAQHTMTVVAIEGQGEDTFLYTMLPTTTSGAWIGLRRVGGGFKWDATNAATNYTNWANGEPNNDKGVENCVVMWGHEISLATLRGRWNDAPCDTPTRDAVLCER